VTNLLWLFHNTIIHPICGLLWHLGAERLGDWLHDLTVPRDH